MWDCGVSDVERFDVVLLFSFMEKDFWFWVFIERVNAEAEAPVLWPPDAKNWLIGKDSDPRKDWTQEEKGKTEDKMAGWHPWLDGHESEQALGVSSGQGGLVCCSLWGCEESDMTEPLNWLIDWLLVHSRILLNFNSINAFYSQTLR